MAADQPFAPLQNATTGAGITLSVSITNQGFLTVIAPAIATNILVTNTTTVTLFVRMSKEASPIATSTDVAIPSANSRIFQNPVPQGTLGIGVYGSAGGVAFPGGGFACFTPGNAGED